MLQTDIRHDVVRSFYNPLAELEAAEVESVFVELTQEAAELLRTEGLEDADHYFARSVDMRYVGQEYTVNVPIPEAVDLTAIDASFHDAHRVRYGHSTPGAPVEFVNLRLAGFGRIAGSAAPYHPPDDELDPVAGTRDAVFDGATVTTTVLHRDRLRPGAMFEGPIVVEEQSSTTVVPPGYEMTVDRLGNLLITKASSEALTR
jgi:N-methylhydantoinase A